jgi:hypothetical protein
MAKDDEVLHRDFTKIRKYVQQYTSFDRIYVKITNQYDDLGRLRVEVPIFKGYDSINNIREIQLNVFLGLLNSFR